jgi:hypothetical protein
MTTPTQASDGPIARFVTRFERRTIVASFTLYFLALFATVMPPLFQFFNRMEPFVFGLSFVLFWILLVGLLISLGLAVLYRVEAIRGELV